MSARDGGLVGAQNDCYGRVAIPGRLPTETIADSRNVGIIVRCASLGVRPSVHEPPLRAPTKAFHQPGRPDDGSTRCRDAAEASRAVLTDDAVDAWEIAGGADQLIK